jgi:hypothetical protein
MAFCVALNQVRGVIERSGHGQQVKDDGIRAAQSQQEALPSLWPVARRCRPTTSSTQ